MVHVQIPAHQEEGQVVQAPAQVEPARARHMRRQRLYRGVEGGGATAGEEAVEEVAGKEEEEEKVKPPDEGAAEEVDLEVLLFVGAGVALHHNVEGPAPGLVPVVNLLTLILT